MNKLDKIMVSDLELIDLQQIAGHINAISVTTLASVRDDMHRGVAYVCATHHVTLAQAEAVKDTMHMDVAAFRALIPMISSDTATDCFCDGRADGGM